MTAGQTMRHVTLHLMREDLPRAGLALAELESFVPDDRPLHAEEMSEIPGENYRKRLHQAESEASKGFPWDSS